VDRGLNQRRLEFLAAKDDSVRHEMQRSAGALAGAQERAQLGADPQDAARALSERMGLLEQRISEVRAGERALDSLLQGARNGSVDVRAIAGFPDLLRSPAINDIVSQVARLDAERTLALARSAPGSPQVKALAEARDSLVGQILPIASTYRSSLTRQRISLERDRDALRAQVARLPREGVGVLQEQAELERLAQLNMGMGAQVLEARLAALLEGGDVRLVDPAVPPRRVSFPRPVPTLAAGLLGGVLLGLLLAFLRDTRGSQVAGAPAPARD
jgi:tyrosine-protein kinase Etk/Wzc